MSQWLWWVPAALTAASMACSGEPCDSGCPGEQVCVADRCRMPCTDHGQCDPGFVCFKEYCEEGDLLPGDAQPGDPQPTSCGNSIIEAGEACDGTDLGGQETCDSFAGYTGTEAVSCMATCALHDLRLCLDTPSSCGNGGIQGDEQCDDPDLNNQSCTSLGFSDGTLTCNGNCSFDVTGCQGP